MRKICLVLLILFTVLNYTLYAQDVDFRDPETWLLGYFEPDELLQSPHDNWFNKEFDSYQIDNESFMELAEMSLKDIEVLIVLGTWCPDSRREVPRFMKLAQLIGLDQGLISMMGTDSYKEAPVENYENLNIERVPTFIFYHKKNEIGRIIEYPVASLEKDIIGILRRTANGERRMAVLE